MSGSSRKSHKNSGMAELTTTDKLLVLLLLKLGTSQAEVAKALSVKQPTVSRYFGGVKKLTLEATPSSESGR